MCAYYIVVNSADGSHVIDVDVMGCVGAHIPRWDSPGSTVLQLACWHVVLSLCGFTPGAPVSLHGLKDVVAVFCHLPSFSPRFSCTGAGAEPARAAIKAAGVPGSVGEPGERTRAGRPGVQRPRRATDGHPDRDREREEPERTAAPRDRSAASGTASDGECLAPTIHKITDMNHNHHNQDFRQDQMIRTRPYDTSPSSLTCANLSKTLSTMPWFIYVLYKRDFKHIGL